MRHRKKRRQPSPFDTSAGARDAGALGLSWRSRLPFMRDKDIEKTNNLLIRIIRFCPRGKLKRPENSSLHKYKSELI